MNCIVICCDTFRYDMLTDPSVKTPNLDRLVESGRVFTNAFGEGLPTIQARRTMMTGLCSYPWRFEMDSRGLWPTIPGWHRVPSEQLMLSEHLFENGVVTGLVGDTYHMFKPTQNFTRGFCSWNFIRGQEGDPVRSGPLSKVDVSPYLPDGENDLSRIPPLTQYLLNMLDRKTEEDYLPARVFREACTWLEENAENAPWFLWIDSFAPHERWDPPQSFADAYYTTTESKDYIQPQVINNLPPSEAQIERTKALYYGYVTFVDKWIGTLLDKVEDMNLADDTAVIFTSDHGTELWDKGQFSKGGDRLYRYNTSVPLVIRVPGEKGRLRDQRLIQHQDLFPTICNLMDVDYSSLGLDGEDIISTREDIRDYAIIGWSNNVSVRNHDWNMVIKGSGDSEENALYDLQNDPAESTNVYADNSSVVKELTDALENRCGKLPHEVKHSGDSRHIPPLVTSCRNKREE